MIDQNPNFHAYIIITLIESDLETSVVFDENHYLFDEQYYFDSIVDLDRKSAQLDDLGKKYMILNTHAFNEVICSSQIEKLSAELNITHNYTTKQ